MSDLEYNKLPIGNGRMHPLESDGSVNLDDTDNELQQQTAQS